MPFEQIETLLEKYYNGDTSLEEERQLKDYFKQTKLLPDHLKVHAIQFEAYDQEQKVELDKFLNDDWLFEKIEGPALASQTILAKPKSRNFFSQYSWQIAASISLLLVAFWAGNYYNSATEVVTAPTPTIAVQAPTQEQEPAAANQIQAEPTETASASTETQLPPSVEPEERLTPSPRRQTRTVLAAATTVADASASERLQMVRQELETDGLTPEENQKVIRQLVKTMNQDNNVNVRLAACEALYKFREHPEARKAFIQALGTQTDPIMQITLIEVVTSLKEKTAVPQLQNLVGRDDLLPIVKYKAQEGLGTLI
ncbi:HEAT repeat domain-containing protein [Rufibacter roseus]|uniref:HEAT repeat domain-containing protein n=1 Tax=Rufibacter roseus TaxID=1567108 RepID=A0ABW2DI20_9BACT|nr:HEAT repeat domain-containing protein [Rufibacter roseus]